MLSWQVLAPRSLQDSIHAAISMAGEGGPGSIEDGDQGSRKLVAHSHGEASAALVHGEIKQTQQKSRRTNGNHTIETIIISLPA